MEVKVVYVDRDAKKGVREVKVKVGNVVFIFQKDAWGQIRKTGRYSESQVYDARALSIPDYLYKKMRRQVMAIFREREKKRRKTAKKVRDK